MSKINILPDNVANQIAAGEVVTRPASCVKELVENAIDAGAENITVIIKDAGKKLIEVTDDGSGMSEVDCGKAFLRHATSKIRDIKDLDYLGTLGFRGEALASISSVSRVEVLTKTNEDETGTYMEVEDSRIKKQEHKASSKGTAIKIKDLFYNTPARLKFLKSKYTEESHITDTIISQGLANTGISFRLVIDGKEIIMFPKNSTLKERIRIIQGKEIHDALVEISEYTDNVKVTGYACKPEVAKNNKSSQYLFVNGRPVSSRSISYAIYEGYGTLLMKGKYAAAFVFIEANPSIVDVNVHPAKAEVKFRNERMVYAAVKTAIENGLQSSELIKRVAPEISNTYTAEDVFSGSSEYSERVENSVKEFYANETSELFNDTKVEMKKGGGIQKEIRSERRDFLRIKALGQINKTYIAGEDENHMILIDQHAAHEKVLYSRIAKDIRAGNLKIQEMLIPEIIEITPSEKMVVENNLNIFEQMGFTLEQFGENEFKVSAHPVMLRDKAVAPFVIEMINELREKGKVEPEELLRNLAATIACRAAVKGGDVLKDEEIESMLNEYFEIDEPFSCPHGRPAIIKISFDEIEKMFKRKL